ncbi:unnamed protein product [Linum tenue]|uniref:Uncharacterized protein n=1 Tax=Linum tenue TaxID=586396 RepID=A0AAV0P8J1_9ROSI|nr:unnamed protein product [Linum tenue]
MKVFSGGRQFARLLKSSVLLNSAAGCRNFSSESWILAAPQAACLPWLHQLHDATFSSVRFPGHYTAKAHFSTESNNAEIAPTEAVKEFHEKILESVNTKRTMSPNAWLWSLIEKCESHKDIELLFDCLENIRRFRLSNLRIHDNFNCNLCREVAKACARAGAIDFGMCLIRLKLLSDFDNLFLLGCLLLIFVFNHAPMLQKNAKVHDDVKLMVEIMGLLKKNDVPLQPSTADIVFSICNNVGNLELMAKYLKKFVKAGVQLRTAAFDASMDLAAKKGDTEALWDIEKLRSKSMKQLSLVTGFSCAKGLILGRKPQEAASIIQVLNETLPETKKSGIMVELQKLASEWPLDVVKHQSEDKRKELAAALKSDIPAMISALLNTGLEVSVDLENLTSKEEMLQ